MHRVIRQFGRPFSAVTITALLVCALGRVSWAQTETSASKNMLRFVYIHGTNQNTPGKHEQFNRSVARLHPQIKSAMERDPLVQSDFLEGGALGISDQTLNFFWGDKSQVAIQAVRRSVFNPQLGYGWLQLGQRARQKLNFTLHDAIWLEKESDKKAVLDALYRAIMEDRQQPIVLMGHSAGSLVAFNLLLYRLPYLNIQDFARELAVPPDVLAMLQQQNASSTCLEALMSSSSIRYDAQGKLVPFLKGLESIAQTPDIEAFRQKRVADLPLYTQQYCLPEGMVRGLVTFGSPLMLFYSTVANPEKDESYLTANMMRYMLARHMVWLHVNHSDDFIALPLPKRQQILTAVENRLGVAPVLGGGFISDYLYLRKGANLYDAHGWYWNRPKVFAHAVTRAYDLGYRDWYPTKKP